MHLRISLQVAASLIFVAPVALAQDLLQGSAHYAFDPSDGAQVNAFQKTVAVDLSHDGVLDLVTLIDGVPVMAFNPSFYMGYFALPTTAGDMLPVHVGGHAHPDGLLVTNDQGVSLWTADPDTYAFVSSSVGDLTRSDLQWLHTGDLDGDGTLDLVGVDPAGDRLHMAYDVLDDASRTWVTTPALPAIRDLTMLNWDGLPGDELVMVTTAGLRIHKHTGQLVYSDASVAATDKVAALNQPGVRDMVVRVSGGGTTLHVSSQSAPNHTTLDVSAHGVSRVSCADLDDDGDDEIFCSLLNEGFMLVLLNNDGSVPAFSLDDKLHLDLGRGSQSTPNNTAVIGVEDLDGDGDLDAFVEVAESEEVRVFENLKHSSSDLHPHLVGGGYSWDEGGQEGTIVFEVEKKLDTLGQPFVPSAYDHVELTLWVQRAETLAMNLSHEAVFNGVFPCVGNQASLTATYGQHFLVQKAHIVEMRFVRTAADGTVIGGLTPVKTVFSANGTSVQAFSDLTGQPAIFFEEISHGGPDPPEPTGCWGLTCGFYVLPGWGDNYILALVGNSDADPGVIPDVEQKPCFDDEIPSKGEKGDN